MTKARRSAIVDDPAVTKYGRNPGGGLTDFPGAMQLPTVEAAIDAARLKLEAWRTTWPHRDWLDALYAIAMADTRWGQPTAWQQLLEEGRKQLG